MPEGTFRTGHAFLDDIAHTAAPKAGLLADDDTAIGGEGAQPAGTYDNELLDRHFITGDGRGNENIGLTAVHAVFTASITVWLSNIKQHCWKPVISTSLISG